MIPIDRGFGHQMRHKATFYRRDRNSDDYGEAGEDWSNLGDRYCTLRIDRSREMVDAGAPADSRRGRLSVRADSLTKTITSDDSVEVRGFRWKIESSYPSDIAGRWIEMVLVTGKAP